MTPRTPDELLDDPERPYARSCLVRWLQHQEEAAPLHAYLDRVADAEPALSALAARHMSCFDPSLLRRLVYFDDDTVLRSLVLNPHLDGTGRRRLARQWVDVFLDEDGHARYARALGVLLEEGFSLGTALRGRLLAQVERRQGASSSGADLVVGRAIRLLQMDPELTSFELERLDGLLPDVTWQRLLPALVGHPGADAGYWSGLVAQAEGAEADGAAIISDVLAACPRARRDPEVWAFLLSTDALPLATLRSLVEDARGHDFSRLVRKLVRRNHAEAVEVLEDLDDRRLDDLATEDLQPLLGARNGDVRQRALRLLARCGRRNGVDGTTP